MFCIRYTRVTDWNVMIWATTTTTTEYTKWNKIWFKSKLAFSDYSLMCESNDTRKTNTFSDQWPYFFFYFWQKSLIGNANQTLLPGENDRKSANWNLCLIFVAFKWSSILKFSKMLPVVRVLSGLKNKYAKKIIYLKIVAVLIHFFLIRPILLNLIWLIDMENGRHSLNIENDWRFCTWAKKHFFSLIIRCLYNCIEHDALLAWILHDLIIQLHSIQLVKGVLEFKLWPVVDRCRSRKQSDINSVQWWWWWFLFSRYLLIKLACFQIETVNVNKCW